MADGETITLLRDGELEELSRALLSAAGADEATCLAATRAMMHASRLGVDSHGIRLLPHYLAAIEGGRVNGRPTLRFEAGGGAVATLHADNAHGAVATFAAMERGVELSRRFGIGAVAIRDSSHFGAAGAYALAAAECGVIGIATCNSDSFVRLHGGAERFHGTNPIAVGVPVSGARPWLLDMATSAIPYNRVQLYRSLGVPLPEGTASTPDGRDTSEAAEADMLAPLGAAFGFKGAGLAGMVEILSAVLTGMRLSFEIAPMPGPDMTTPRGMGAFVIAIDPAAFISRAEFDEGMRRYLDGLRSSRRADGVEAVMAPGDREWTTAERRAREGIPVDVTTHRILRERSEALGLPIGHG
ncbi:Ldh family oxidoreductase [Aureimonas mangrovi]|uniref:Ldh family oxidoreductase n=1 Tax=Aureimonas mangrovi TaxID=2758041 RepID=UPI00163DD415|nr:Ldh family oxidoreductase [Aureimonas mangrovi]